jgi:hypothetical protein
MQFNEAAREKYRDPERRFPVDLRGVSIEARRSDTRFAAYVASLPSDVEVGTLETLRSYSQWGYAPGATEDNPMASLLRARDLQDFPVPDVAADYRPAALREKVGRFQREGFAVVGYQPSLGGIIFEAAYRLFCFQRFLVELISGRELAAVIMDRLAEQCRAHSTALAQAGVDVLRPRCKI